MMGWWLIWQAERSVSYSQREIMPFWRWMNARSHALALFLRCSSVLHHAAPVISSMSPIDQQKGEGGSAGGGGSSGGGELGGLPGRVGGSGVGGSGGG